MLINEVSVMLNMYKVIMVLCFNNSDKSIVCWVKIIYHLYLKQQEYI